MECKTIVIGILEEDLTNPEIFTHSFARAFQDNGGHCELVLLDEKKYNRWLGKRAEHPSERVHFLFEMHFLLKKVTYKKLARYLAITEQAVKQMNPRKRYLMLLGLSHIEKYSKRLIV